MTIGYQVIKLSESGNDDGAKVFSQVEQAIASKAPILLCLGNYLPLWATDASISEGTATVHAYMGAAFLTLTISSAGVSITQDTVAFSDENA